MPRGSWFVSAIVFLAHAWRPGRAPASIGALRERISHDAKAKLDALRSAATAPGAGLPSAEKGGSPAWLTRQIDAALLRAAPLLAARFDTLGRAAEFRARLIALARNGPRRAPWTLREVAPAGNPEAEIEALQRERAALFDLAAAPYARRLSTVLEGTAAEVQEEQPRRSARGPVPIEAEISPEGREHWVPVGEVETWRDLLRNLLRNAVEATIEHPAAEPRTVTARLRGGRGGETILEIVDRGIGMSPPEVERIFDPGWGRHGPERGRGLTSASRQFLEAQGRLEIRSAPAVGTVVRVDLAPRDVPLPRIYPWRSHPLSAVSLLLLATLTLPPVLARQARSHLDLPVLLRAPADAVEVYNSTAIQAFDAQGEVVWRRDLHEEITPNSANPFPPHTTREELVVREKGGDARLLVVATAPPEGRGRLWLLDPDRRIRHIHPCRWTPPDRHIDSRLICWWRTAVPWPAGDNPAIVYHLRDNLRAPSMTGFLSIDGDSLGAYYHPGHLVFRAADDFDQDGRTELLLYGINNPAQEDTAWLPDPLAVYIDCVVLLELPRVSGQAWPYRSWSSLPRAREEGYLLVPPLRSEWRPEIRMLDILSPGSASGHRFEIQLSDGRILRAGPDLRPIAITLGGNTPAQRLAPTRSIAPWRWFHDGVEERIDLPVPYSQPAPPMEPDHES